MALTTYKKQDMVYKDYKWTARADHDNPNIVGWPDDSLFSRYEGYEMLHFINALAKLNNWEGNPLSSYKNSERILRTELPSDIRSRKKVLEWLNANYQKV